MNQTIVDYKCLAKATVNGVPVADVLIHRDWHLAAYAAQSIVPESTADHTVQLTHPVTKETRTFLVKGWYEFKQSAREVRHQRKTQQ